MLLGVYTAACARVSEVTSSTEEGMSAHAFMKLADAGSLLRDLDGSNLQGG